MYTHREPSAWHREQTGAAESHRICRERHGIQAFETRFAGRDFCSLIVLVTINTRSIKQENELIKPKGSRIACAGWCWVDSRSPGYGGFTWAQYPISLCGATGPLPPTIH
jgi:hypothetical protein